MCVCVKVPSKGQHVLKLHSCWICSGQNTFRCHFLWRTPGAVPCCSAAGRNPSGDHLWCPLTPIKQHCAMWAASHSGWKTSPFFAKSLRFKDFCFYCHPPVCSRTQSFPGFLPEKKKKNHNSPPLLSQPVPDFLGKSTTTKFQLE